MKKRRKDFTESPFDMADEEQRGSRSRLDGIVNGNVRHIVKGFQDDEKRYCRWYKVTR